ncbi:MAG: glutamine--tRNA ligase [Verrucomicrobiales bacterium]
MSNEPSTEPAAKRLDFIRQIVADDLAAGKHETTVTRFPPEPNGYLHIGHAKSICLNFGIAQEVPGGVCHLRFDDTNPTKEETEYVESIMADIRWLGFDWGDKLFFASDYFDQLYAFAVHLIESGKAYVDEQTPDQIRATRGTLTEPGTPSPYRDRPAAESLALFEKMKAGELAEGACVLRAKIDMASPNLNMRDPVIYRILRQPHHRTGDKWNIYPMYDYAHPLSDALESITHSLCTLEFENHRPLYDWCVEALADQLPARPRQIEFARLGLNYTVMSKRKFLQLVNEKHVSGWDDPRMPTISGLRRRGYTPESIRNFCATIGITKFNSVTDIALLEHAAREHLNAVAARRLAVLNPLKVVITKYPEGESEEFEAVNNPEDEAAGTRQIPFYRELLSSATTSWKTCRRNFFRLAPAKRGPAPLRLLHHL